MAEVPAGLAEDRDRALQLTPVSRETLARLDRFVEIFLAQQQRMNLIARSSIPQLWTRHIADSLQLLPLANATVSTWVDLGSGGGFPGLVIACAMAERPNAVVHLVESTKKKAAFLAEAARHIGAPAIVHPVRIEDFVKNFDVRPDAITARALAPLEQLLALAYPLSKTGAQSLFPKGQDVESELTKAAKYWKFEPILVPSKTNPLSRIVIVGHWERRDTKR